MQQSNPKFKGGALLTALFIMTLVAIVATAMSTKLQTDIHQARLMMVQDKLYLATQGVLFWAFNELQDEDKKYYTADSQGKVSTFPARLHNLYPAATLDGGLYDLQALYNINNLNNKKSLGGFTHFIKSLLPQLKKTERKNLVAAIHHWLSPYYLSITEDVYSAYYLRQVPPYTPGHQLFNNRSELRLVKEVDAKTFLSLERFLIALPEPTPININTAPKEVLMALNETLEDEQIEELIKARGKKGIKKLDKISGLLKKLNINKEQVTIESSYFLNEAHASSDGAQITLYSILKKTRDAKGKTSISLVRQSINTF